MMNLITTEQDESKLEPSPKREQSYEVERNVASRFNESCDEWRK